MGNVRDAFNEIYPDGPSSLPAMPYKAAIRNLGSVIDDEFSAVRDELDGVRDIATTATQWKTPVQVASGVNIVIASGLVNGVTIDGVVVSTGQRVLLFGQTTASQNGIYIVAASGAASRATDADSAGEVLGMAMLVRQGSTYAGQQFVCTAVAPITLGTTALPFVAIGAADQTGQLVQPTVNGLSTLEDVRYVGPLPYDVQVVHPSGAIVAAIDRTTGLPITPGGSTSEASPAIVITRTPNNLYIHQPQPSGLYIRWAFTRMTDVSIRADVWQITGTVLARLDGDVSSSLQQICDNGQVEIAMRRASDGTAFNIGGWHHGRDEMLASPVMLVDGVKVDITTGTETIRCNRLEIFQASQLLDPDDLSNVGKRYTKWEWFGPDLFLSNRIVFEKAVAFSIIYMAMLPVRRIDGSTQITHSGIRAPLYYPTEDLSGTRSPYTTTAQAYKVWGDTVAGEIEVLEGWDLAGRNAWVSSDNSRNKIYFDKTGARTPAIGEVLSMKSRLRVSSLS